VAFFTSIGDEMITGEQKQVYLDFFNQALNFDMQIQDLKMITETDSEGNPLAVAVFSNCSKYNMEISIASKPSWSASRRFIKECANYAFITCGVLRLTNYAEENNSKSLNFSKRLGFKREFNGVLKNWFGNINGVQLVMMKENCKWLNT
jgi:hypothetical protein